MYILVLLLFFAFSSPSLCCRKAVVHDSTGSLRVAGTCRLHGCVGLLVHIRDPFLINDLVHGQHCSAAQKAFL